LFRQVKEVGGLRKIGELLQGVVVLLMKDSTYIRSDPGPLSVVIALFLQHNRQEKITLVHPGGKVTTEV
jgi:hypothetical protein